MDEMSPACADLVDAAAGMTLEELTAQISAADRDIPDPQTLAAYLLSMAGG